MALVLALETAEIAKTPLDIKIVVGSRVGEDKLTMAHFVDLVPSARPKSAD
jgi:hypothetical protein